MFQLQNSWTYFDKILYEHYAIGSQAKLIIFEFLQSVITILADTWVCEVGATLVAVSVLSWNDVW
jgi:uncharacterized membrane protein